MKGSPTEQLAERLTAIAEGTRKLDERVQSIAAGSGEQTVGIVKIAAAVTVMSGGIEANASHALKSGERARQLGEQASALTPVVRSQGDL